MAADVTIKVTLKRNGTVYDIDTKPYKAKTNKPGSFPVALEWDTTVSGTSFPAENYFAWKPNTVPPPPIPTRVSATKLTLDYTTVDETVTWEYTICITDGTVTICEDPEVENEVPPGGGGEDDKDKDKDKENEDQP